MSQFAKLKETSDTANTSGLNVKHGGKAAGILVKGVLLMVLVGWLAGCGGGGDGGAVTLTTDGQGEDPVVLEIPIAYIKRPLPEEVVDLRDPLVFQPGARLLVRDRASTAAEDFDVTEQIAEIVAEEQEVAIEELLIDVKDLESSYDGNTLIFAARVVAEPVSANLELTTWNLWTFDLDTRQAAYLINSRTLRNEGVESGGGHDIAPHFLPDDRIVFSSTRQVASQALQLNEGRAQIFSALDEQGDDPAAVLHIYDPQKREAEFSQISFNLSHDLDPTVLGSGEIVFSRWNNTTSNHISLFRIQPSGIGLSPLYGYHSQSIGTDGAALEFTQPRELDNGQLISLARSFSPASFGGDIVVIDTEGFAELDQPVWANQGTNGEGHQPLTPNDITTDDSRSDGGQYGSVYPLRDGTNRVLVTWSECRVMELQATDETAENDEPIPTGRTLPCSLEPENNTLATPLYGAWVYNVAEDTQQPVVLAEEGFQISDIVAAESRAYPDLIPQPESYDPDLAINHQGRLLIDSVYDMDGVDNSPLGIAQHAQPGTAAYRERPVRFVRVVQPVPLPDPEVYEIPRYAFGVTAAFSFREIAGYAPVEPDGSVTVTVPANRPFNFSLLDADGQRIGARHNYWLQVAPGEVLQCSGCHNGSSALPHGRLDSQPISSNPGARALADGSTGFPGTDSTDLFANGPGETMAVVWDSHRPEGNETQASRMLSLSQAYEDEWSGPDITPDAVIDNRDYDSSWLDIPPDKKIIVSNLDANLPGRIVINYIDHIQPIWERDREPIADATGVLFSNCVGCHNGSDATVVAAGQLDLTSASSDIDANHYRSYRELLSTDGEQWLNAEGNVADRQRLCIEEDEEGNSLEFLVSLNVRASLRAGSAAASNAFFSCFAGGICGREDSPALPDNCTEDGGTPIPATRNTVNHQGLLSASELRLIREWLDIGGQYFNNPFDPRLQEN